MAHHEAEVYLKWSEGTGALVPLASVVTVTSTKPEACGGLTALIWESERTRKLAAAELAKWTAVAPVNPHPFMYIVVPPMIGPAPVLRVLTVGAPR